MTRRIALGALAALAVASASTSVLADALSNQVIWKTYWMAIEAQKTCKSAAFTQGEYDAMTLVESNDEHAVMALLYQIGAQGRMRTHTHRAYNSEETKRSLEKLAAGAAQR